MPITFAVARASTFQASTIAPAEIAAQAKPLTSNGVATAAHCPSESSDPDNARTIGKVNCREKIAGTKANMKTN